MELNNRVFSCRNCKYYKNARTQKDFIPDNEHQNGFPALDHEQALINEKTVYAVNQSMNVVHTDIDGYVLYGNQNIYDLTLYKPEELLGGHTRIFNPGYHSKEFFKDLWDTILAGKIWRGDIKNKRKDGEIIWVRLIITPLLDDDGKPYQFIALKEDITEKKEIEFQLAKKDKQLSALTSNSHDIVGVMNKAGKITYTNPAFERVLGFTVSEALHSNIIDYIDKEDISLEKSLLQKIMESPNASIRHHSRLKHKDGTYRWCEVVFSNYLEDPYINGIVFNLRDYTKQKEANDIIKHLANYDYLTGLPNRRYFEGQLEKALNNAKTKNEGVAIISLDLDGFKAVNDTFGHDTGDILLKRAGQRISCVFQEKGFVGRIGGDEFLSFIPSSDIELVAQIATSLVDTFNNPFTIEDHKINITASVGISMYPESGTDMRTLLINADSAMYEAKKKGKNDFRFFSPMARQA